jgi:hypothetical protein
MTTNADHQAALLAAIAVLEGDLRELETQAASVMTLIARLRERAGITPPIIAAAPCKKIERKAKIEPKRKPRGAETFGAELKSIAVIADQIEAIKATIRTAKAKGDGGLLQTAKDELGRTKCRGGELLIKLGGRATLPISKITARAWTKAHRAVAGEAAPAAKVKKGRKPQPRLDYRTRQCVGAWQTEPDGSMTRVSVAIPLAGTPASRFLDFEESRCVQNQTVPRAL